MAVMAMSLAVATGSVAQERIRVKGGDAFDYTISMSTDMEQRFQGQEMSTSAAASGNARMEVSGIAPGGIDWGYRIIEMKTRIIAPMLGEQDTTVSMPAVSFTTDPQGRLRSTPEFGELAPAMPGMEALAGVEQFFSPLLSRQVTVGDTWETTQIDTVDAGGLQALTARAIRHTYEGVVDTLGRRAHRVRSEATKLTVEGSGNVQGMDMTMDGDGTSLALAYYSLSDGLLLASTLDSQIDTRLSLSGMGAMIIPITSRTRMEIVRK